MALGQTTQAQKHQSLAPTFYLNNKDTNAVVPLSSVLKNVKVLHLNSDVGLGRGIFVIPLVQNFVVADLEQHNVYIFDERGNQQIDINIHNKSSDRFSFIGQIWKQNQEICVFDPSLNTIFHYNSRGVLVRKVESKLPNVTSLVSDDNYYYFDLNRVANPGEKENKYNIRVFDKKMNHVRPLVPYNYEMPFNTGVSISNFNIYNSEIYYHQPHSKNIYRVSNGQVGLEVIIDFKDSWAWENIEANSSISTQVFLDKAKQPGKVISFNSWVSDRNIFLSYRKGKAPFFTLIDRKKKSIKSIDFKGILESFVVNSWYNQQLQLIVPKSEVETLLSLLDKSQVEEVNESLKASFCVLWLEFDTEKN